MFFNIMFHFELALFLDFVLKNLLVVCFVERLSIEQDLKSSPVAVFKF